ncbi:MAG TPA: hypothetical protein PKA70_23295 [Saprospiraceae bacterium]|nr:hypothetical protein [Saprospiraceae bacterium]
MRIKVRIFETHQMIQRTLYPLDGSIAYMRVTFRRFRTVVSQQRWNDAYVCSCFVKVRGKTMAQRMKTYLFFDAHLLFGSLKYFLHTT